MEELIKKYLTIEEETVFNSLSSKKEKDTILKVLINQLVYTLNDAEKEIEKRDKIIDLMADKLTTPVNGKEWVKKYYEELVEKK